MFDERSFDKRSFDERSWFFSAITAIKEFVSGLSFFVASAARKGTVLTKQVSIFIRKTP